MRIVNPLGALPERIIKRFTKKEPLFCLDGFIIIGSKQEIYSLWENNWDYFHKERRISDLFVKIVDENGKTVTDNT